MPATIILRSPDSIADKRIRLSNAQFGRPFNFGTWTQIRVGFRVGFTDYGAAPPGNFTFYLGLCHGTTNMPGDVACAHFVGLTNSYPCTRNTSSNAAYYSTTSAIEFIVIVGGSASKTAASSSLIVGAEADRSGKNRTAFFLDYTKISGSQMGLKGYWHKTDVNPWDIEASQFVDMLETESLGSNSQHSWSNAVTFSVSEDDNGVLDTVAACWPRTNPQMEISDIGVCKFS